MLGLEVADLVVDARPGRSRRRRPPGVRRARRRRRGSRGPPRPAGGARRSRRPGQLAPTAICPASSAAMPSRRASRISSHRSLRTVTSARAASRSATARRSTGASAARSRAASRRVRTCSTSAASVGQQDHGLLGPAQAGAQGRRGARAGPGAGEGGVAGRLGLVVGRGHVAAQAAHLVEALGVGPQGLGAPQRGRRLRQRPRPGRGPGRGPSCGPASAVQAARARSASRRATSRAVSASRERVVEPGEGGRALGPLHAVPRRRVGRGVVRGHPGGGASAWASWSTRTCSGGGEVALGAGRRVVGDGTGRSPRRRPRRGRRRAPPPSQERSPSGAVSASGAGRPAVSLSRLTSAGHGGGVLARRRGARRAGAHAASAPPGRSARCGRPAGAGCGAPRSGPAGTPGSDPGGAGRPGRTAGGSSRPAGSPGARPRRGGWSGSPRCRRRARRGAPTPARW